MVYLCLGAKFSSSEAFWTHQELQWRHMTNCKTETYIGSEKSNRVKQNESCCWQLNVGGPPWGPESAPTQTSDPDSESGITTGGWQEPVMTHPSIPNGLWSRTMLPAHRALTILTASLRLSENYIDTTFTGRKRKTQPETVIPSV